MKRKYTVNVHYDAVVTVDVIAESEVEALDLAPIEAECISLEDAEIADIDCCIINEEPT